jgi:type IV secretion system protein VirB8
MTKHQVDAELKSYFREARTWAEDRQERVSRSQRVAWIIAGVATTIAALEAIALAGLAPLKTVVPMTVLVDRQTGHVTTLDPSLPSRLAPDAALAKSMLAQYVTARESIDRSTIGQDYRKVVLWSGDTARSSYVALMKPGSPGNPLVHLPRQLSIQAKIKSVSLLEAGEALVRYDLVQQNAGGGEEAPAPFVSIIRYRYRDRPLAEADRFINPLGFEVLRYRRDPEAVPVETPPAAVSQAPVPAPVDPAPATAPGLEGRQ